MALELDRSAVALVVSDQQGHESMVPLGNSPQVAAGQDTPQARPGHLEPCTTMRAVELVFAIGWAAFWIYWLVAAFSTKRGRVPWSRELRIRAVVVVGADLLIRWEPFEHGGSTRIRGAPASASCSSRSGWGSPSGPAYTRAQLGHTDVTKGRTGAGDERPVPPVRHPIYSGILVAGFGTAVALSWLWMIAVALAGCTSPMARPSRSAT